MKIAETTKVALNTIFSRPRRVNELDPPHDLPKPVPFDCTSIRSESVIAVIICKIISALCIEVL